MILQQQVSDVVPVACRAAADAGIRSVCVTNFRYILITSLLCCPLFSLTILKFKHMSLIKTHIHNFLCNCYIKEPLIIGMSFFNHCDFFFFYKQTITWEIYIYIYIFFYFSKKILLKRRTRL